ncbi:MAG TPA: AraC family transcriptional regulator, partial [Candidatus Methylacidiphilales bacterium]
ERVGLPEGRLRAPKSRGLRLRLPGKPFHATPEFFFQEGGTTRFELPSETAAVGPGGAFLVPAGMPHGEAWTGRAFLNLIVMFQPEGFSLHLGYRENGQGPLRCGPIDRFPGPERIAALRYAEEIADLTREGEPDGPLLRGLYQALLGRLLRGMRPDGPGDDGAGDDLVAGCLAMIDVHFARLDFSVAWLARELHCSPDHLSRRFRRATGTRLVEAVHRRRVEHARALLRDSDMNVAEIAWASGFSQPSYFNRIFRAATGLTPKELRRRIGGRPVLSHPPGSYRGREK